MKIRPVIKTITWRLIASVTTFILAIIFFSGSENATEKAFGIAISESIIKMILYYYHEVIWDKYKGKTKIKDNGKI